MRFLFSIFFILIVYSASSQLAANFKEPLQMIDAWLDAQRDFDKLPGLSVAIVNDQEIIFSKGYGYADVENKVPMQPETICSICSISKLFTSVALMSLWEAGKVRLDDSVSGLLPSFNLKQSYQQTVPVTVRSLLTHSSGLPREADYAYWSAPDFYFPTEEELNAKLGEQQTLYPASTYFQYSNLGMSILGEIVAKVSGTTYNTYVDKTILQPLQLTNTHPYLPQKLWGTKMAKGYSALYRDGSRKAMPFFQAKGITPAAGYSSNVIDLAHFASWQLRLLSNNNKEIIRSSTLKEMQRVQWMDPDRKIMWGLGFEIDDENKVTYIGHGGSCPGYRTLLLLAPKNKLAVSIMINAQGVDNEKYARGIFNILNKATEDFYMAFSNADLDAYAGNYDNYTWGGESIIVPWKGKLAVFSVPSDNPAENMQLYKSISGDTFRRIRSDDGSLGEELRFERDTSGKVIRVWHNNNFENKIK